VKKKHIKIYFKIIITLSLLTWLFCKLDIQKIWSSLSTISFMLYSTVLVTYFIADLFRSLKWKCLIPNYSFFKLLKVNMIGSYYSMVLPGQIAGEAAKAYILSKDRKGSGDVSVSIIIDKISGIIGLLLLSLAGVFYSQQKLRSNMVSIFSIILPVCFVILFSIRLKYVLQFITDFLYKMRDKFAKATKILSYVEKLVSIWWYYSGKTKLMIMVIIMGIGCQLFIVVIYAVLANKLGIYLAFTDWCWITGFISIVLLLPISIAGMGIREGTLIGILSFYFKIPPEKSMALSLSVVSVQIIWAVVGSILEMKRLKMK
jgi:conserved hypothetical protein